MNNKRSQSELIARPHEITIPDNSPHGSLFVETFVFEATAEEAPLGNLYIVGQVSSANNRKVNAALLSGIVNTIKEEYYRNSRRDQLRSFKSALRRASLRIKEIKKTPKNRSARFNIVACVVTPPHFLMSHVGENLSFLQRDSELHILDNNGALSPLANNASTFRDAVRGILRPEDVIYIATKELHRLDRSEFKKITNSGRFDDFLSKNEKEFKNLGLIIVDITKRFLEEQVAAPTSKRKPVLTSLYQSLKNLSKGDPRKRIIIIGALGVVVVAITFLALFTYQRTAQEQQKVDDLLFIIEEIQERTQALVELQNFEEAESALIEWEKTLEELRRLDVKESIYKNQLEAFTEAEHAVRRYQEVPSTIVLNLEANTLNFSPRGMAANRRLIALFGENTLYLFDQSRREGGFTVLPDHPGLGSISAKDIDFTLPAGQDFVILAGNALLRYDRELSAILTEEILKDSRRVTIYNDTLYFLTKNDILSGKIGGQSLTSWTQETFFNEALDFTIDGFIYVLEGNRVHKLFNGSRHVEINIEDGIERIFTSTNLHNLYLLNPHEGYVAVMDKTGNIFHRLTNENLKEAQSFFVDENENTLYFLSGQRVFTIPIPL